MRVHETVSVQEIEDMLREFWKPCSLRPTFIGGYQPTRNLTTPPPQSGSGVSLGLKAVLHQLFYPGVKSMSWSVSASGKRAAVKEAIDRQLKTENYSGGKFVVEVERARVGIHSLIDSTESTHLSVSGHGSLSGPASVSFSCWNETEQADVQPTAS